MGFLGDVFFDSGFSARVHFNVYFLRSGKAVMCGVLVAADVDGVLEAVHFVPVPHNSTNHVVVVT